VLATCGADGADVALDVLLGLQDRDSRYRSSVIATLETALDAWLEPSVARATGTDGGISPEWAAGRVQHPVPVRAGLRPAPAQRTVHGADQRGRRGGLRALVADRAADRPAAAAVP